jgi:cytidine deaminase
MHANLAHLVEAARAVRDRAYAPHSRFRVGCVLETENGRLFSGCNVENASFGLTMCAERVAVGAAVSSGDRAFRRLILVTDAQHPETPCGACRQVLAEFAPTLEVISVGAGGAEAKWTLNELLPALFVLPPRSERAADET